MAKKRFEVECDKSYQMVEVRRLIDDVGERLTGPEKYDEGKTIINIGNIATGNVGGDVAAGNKAGGDKISGRDEATR